jgi:hypothetical protein
MDHSAGRTVWALMLMAGAVLTAGEPAPAPKQDSAAAERAARDRFFASYGSALDQPLLRADAVLMLNNLKEPESLRVIAGLLGDGAPEVRCAACRLMTETEDPQGYFVKPLMGALRDADPAVRLAAADAMGAARVKSRAIKVLSLALLDAAQENPVPVSYVGAIHRALVRLTGHAITGEVTARELAQLWRDWWQQNHEAFEKSDEEYLARQSGK